MFEIKAAQSLAENNSESHNDGNLPITLSLLPGCFQRRKKGKMFSRRGKSNESLSVEKVSRSKKEQSVPANICLFTMTAAPWACMSFHLL